MNKKTKKQKRWRQGFTLVEMLVSTTVFIMIATMAASLYINVSHHKRKSELEAAIISESRALLEKIAREIRNNTIDYEEYYNQEVLAKKFSAPTVVNAYGSAYGEYAKNFYNPGVTYVSPTNFTNGKNDSIGKGRDGLFAQCNDAKVSKINGTQCPNNSKVLKRTLNTNVGKNWWDGESATAFCDDKYGPPVKCPTNKKGLYTTNVLYLINPLGDTKTMFGREVDGTTGEAAVAMLKLNGEDTNNDTIIDAWKNCDTKFNCKKIPVGPDDLTAAKADIVNQNEAIDDMFFVPLTPRSVNITDLQFIVSPLEDPRKAFAEGDEDVQIQPHVTVLLEIEPSDIISQNFAGILPRIQIQTSVTSRIMHEVKSYSLY